MIKLFLMMMIGHAFADFAFQSPEMARGKNRHNKPINVPLGQKITPCWFYFLTAHAFIHGAFVWALTMCWYFGIAEIISHWLIDFAKCENWTNPHVDQFLHIACKVALVITYYQLYM